MRAAGVPTAETLAVARAAVRRQGGRPRRRARACSSAARRRSSTQALRGRRGARRRRRHRGAPRGPRGLAVRALATGAAPCRSARRRTSSGIGDGDAGPNTGGMGAYSPVPCVRRRRRARRADPPAGLDELARRGTPFVGCLFAGLMLTADGPQRARVQRPVRRPGDAGADAARSTATCSSARRAPPAATSAAPSSLSGDDAAVTVVLAAPDYPARSDYAGAPIDGHRRRPRRAGALVFHGGTAVRDGALVTNGGRILSVTGDRRDTVAEARAHAYAAAGIDLASTGARTGRDIAAAVDG